MKKNPPPVEPAPNPDKIFWIILGVALAIVLYARISLLGIPLERDEGGFAYIGQHLFGSKLLYTDLYDNKLPGLYFLYWLFNQLPGGAEKSIHLGLLLTQAGALGLFFIWIRKAFNFHIAAIATALFAVVALMPGVLGFAAHATQLMLLPVIGGLGLLWDYLYGASNRSWWRLPAAGLLLGFAFIVKQPAAVFIFIAVGATMLAQGSRGQKIGRSFVLGSTALVPFGAVVSYFYLQGRFDDFWRWTYTMPTVQTIGAEESVVYLKMMLPRVVDNNWLFWGLGLSALVALPFTSIPKTAKLWAIGLLLASVLSTSIGLGFLPHYFVPAIPWFALGIAIGLFWAVEKFAAGNKKLLATLATLLIFVPILMNFEYFFKPNYLQILEKSYPWNGFAEAKAVSMELKKRIKPGERVAVLGSEPEINYYIGSDICSPHLYMYPIVRDHALKSQFQQQFLRDIFDCNAAYVVLTASEASWMPGFAETPFFKRDIFPRITERYDLIGRANIGQIPLNIVWDDAVKTHNPPKCPPMFVFKRKR